MKEISIVIPVYNSHECVAELSRQIADALEMQLLLKNTSDGKEYIIDYSKEQKGNYSRI